VRTLRFATWNLRHGAGQAVYSRLQADVVFLQEATEGPSGMWQTVPDGRWGSAVVTSLRVIRPIAVPGYEGWVVGGELESPNGPLAVFSVHAPTSTKAVPRRPYTDEVVTILGVIRGAVTPHTPLVIGGDFNFTLGERHPSEPLKTVAADRRALAAIAEAGLVSCWTAAHPDQPLPQTLRWSGDKSPGKTTPYHCDGILVPQAWTRSVSCAIHTDACYAVSDHNPITATVSVS
jgi:endonuclease/exonuclease/phosphatase family metal-dependent hydrolase